jgi:hypothetical protein
MFRKTQISRESKTLANGADYQTLLCKNVDCEKLNSCKQSFFYGIQIFRTNFQNEYSQFCKNILARQMKPWALSCILRIAQRWKSQRSKNPYDSLGLVYGQDFKNLLADLDFHQEFSLIFHYGI